MIARVNRGAQTMVPRGDTVLRAGDVLVTVATEEAYREARKLCQSGILPA